MEGRRRNDRNDRGDDLRRPGRGGKGKKDFKQLDARQEMKDKDYDRNAPLYDNPSSAYAPVHERRHRMEDGVTKSRGERGGGSALEVFERSARQDARDRRQDYETTSAVRLDRHVQILNRPKVQESQSSDRNHRSTDGRSGSERERGQEATSGRSAKGTKKDGKETPAKKPSGPFSSCRFMDEDLRLCGDQVDPLLLETERDFLVVASLGAQKVGRSTVLSTLLSPFFHENGSSTGHFKVPLGIHSAETFLEGPSSSGVDLCVTMDRLVLLDSPALFESLPAHPLGDPKSELYLMIFLASICHCILVVTDTAVDPELWSFLRLLATLKSKVPDLASWLRSKQAFDGEDVAANAKETVQSLPRLLVVFNNVDEENETQETEELEDFLKHSEWKAAPWIRCARAPHLPGQSAREMLCSKEAATLGKSLRQQLAEGMPGGFGGLPLTEKQWLHHVVDYWDFIHKRSDVQSYFELLSSGRLKSFDSPDPKSM